MWLHGERKRGSIGTRCSPTEAGRPGEGHVETRNRPRRNKVGAGLTSPLRPNRRRSTFLSSNKGVDMSLLPPCKDCLRNHLRRVNYQSLIWHKARYAKPSYPPADEHGWQHTDGNLQFKWTDGLLMPQELVDVLLKEPIQTVQDCEEPELNNPIDVIFDDD